MPATILRLNDIPEDSPIELLTRRKIQGERMLWAHIHLAKGCHVAQHTHENEQIGFVISGKVRFNLGAPGTPEFRQEVLEGGMVILLPSNFPHGVDVLEDTVILDVLSPPGPMGVDRQGADAHAARA